MLGTLAFLAALPLATAQGNALTLSDARATHGILGPARADSKLLPGDSLFLTFVIDGLKADDAGKVQYSIGTEVTDGQGKSVFRQPPRDQEAVNALGGGRVPAFAQVDVGPDQAAGEYTLKVTVTDRAGGGSQTLTHKCQVLDKALGVVRLTTTCDPEGQLPAGLLGPGQSLYVNGAVVGFARDNATKQPNVDVELRVLDDQGKPTVAKPFGGTIKENVPAKATSLPVQFHLGLNRPGKFTVEVKATDRVANKTFTQTFPLTVLSPK
jgi:hypothetical protein